MQMHMLKRMSYLDSEGQKFSQKQLKALKVIGSDGRFLHEAMSRNTSLAVLVHQFLYPEGIEVVQGMVQFDPKAVVHRLAVFGSDDRVKAVVSQTDIIRCCRS